MPKQTSSETTKDPTYLEKHSSSGKYMTVVGRKSVELPELRDP